MLHRLVTPTDILTAATWRLAAWPQERIEAGMAIVADLLAHGVALDEEKPEVEKALSWIADDGRRDPWGALCALVVLQANQACDTALLYSAGFEVLQARQQAMRASHGHRGDALDKLIEEHLIDLPEQSPAEMWASFIDQPGIDERIADFNSVTGVLSYIPYPGEEEIADIGFEAFRRRVQRRKKYFQTQVRQSRLPSQQYAYHDDQVAAMRRSDATPTMKRQMLDALTVERNGLMKATVEKMKSQ